MPLLRADGLPTQHMRALAYWMAAPGLEGTTSIQVCGLEWVAHVNCRRQLMDQMMAKGAGADINHPKHDLFHGMVSKQNESVSSSKKNALLIDELAEWIETAIEAEPRAGRGAPGTPGRRTDRAAGGARLLPHAHQHQTARLRTGEAAARGAEPRLGPGPGPGPQRQRHGSAAAAAEPGRGPRLPLRGRAVGDVPAPPAARRSSDSTSARWPATSPTSRAGTWRATASHMSRRRSRRRSPRAPAAWDWRQVR